MVTPAKQSFAVEFKEGLDSLPGQDAGKPMHIVSPHPLVGDFRDRAPKGLCLVGLDEFTLELRAEEDPAFEIQTVRKAKTEPGRFIGIMDRNANLLVCLANRRLAGRFPRLDFASRAADFSGTEPSFLFYEQYAFIIPNKKQRRHHGRVPICRDGTLFALSHPRLFHKISPMSGGIF